MIEASMQWLAVRCCCQPKKVLGFLRLSAKVAQDARYVELLPRPHHVEVSAWPPKPEATMVLDAPIRLEIRHMGDTETRDTYRYERAIYSEDRPIEFWRTIPGFVEARPE